ncbi:MAG: hypothetical protein ACEY3A_01990 [Wolbachia sp.]
MNERNGWLEKNGLNIEDIKKIKFEGVQVPKESKNVDYLGKVQEFISANLVQESVHAETNKRAVSLKKDMEKISSFFIENGNSSRKEIYNAQYLFKQEVIKAIKEQGYGVSSKEKQAGLIVKGSEPIDIQKVQKIIEGILDRVIEGFKASKIVPEGSIHQNLQGIHESPSEKELSPPLPPKKRKSSDGIFTDGENKKQDIKSSEAQAELTRSKRYAMMLDSQQVAAVLQNTERVITRKKVRTYSNLFLSTGV